VVACSLLFAVFVLAGTSALVERFSNDRFNPSIASTMGGSFCAKDVHLNAWTTREGKQLPPRAVTLGVWDTAGSERYESLTRHYFTNAESAFVCFDLTDLASWQKVSFWVGELHKIEPNCRIYIIGTKLDLITGSSGSGGAGGAGAVAASAGGAVASRTRGASHMVEAAAVRTRCVRFRRSASLCIRMRCSTSRPPLDTLTPGRWL
jgi:small GTP-binding protein